MDLADYITIDKSFICARWLYRTICKCDKITFGNIEFSYSYTHRNARWGGAHNRKKNFWLLPYERLEPPNLEL
jgi:hypothetical protein